MKPLVVCRSDSGDGGWSFHAPDVTDEQIATGDAPALLSGAAAWDADRGDWSNPDYDDYSEALRELWRRGRD